MARPSISTLQWGALLSSIVLRGYVYIFLRWIFVEWYGVFLGAFLIYALCWFRLDGVLKDIERGTARTLKKQKAKQPNGSAVTMDPPQHFVDPRLSDLPGRFSLTGLVTGALTSSRVYNRFNLIVNALLVVMALDNLLGMHINPIYSAHNLTYARVGGVGPNWAKISARVPDEQGARLIYRPTQPLGSWSIGPLLRADNETDYTTVATLTGLDASSQYEYRLAKPDSPMSIHPLFPSSQRFRTFPDPRLGGASHFAFAASSCIKPGFPYVPFKSKFAIDGAEHLARSVRERSLSFVLFLGDFIYSDRPYWPGPQLQSYWKRYRQVYASPQWRAVYEQVPVLNIFDDHEFVNDWAGEGDDKTPIASNAVRAYNDYNGKVNPNPVHPGVSYYTYRYADTAFFVFDTRRYRSANSLHDDENKTMLGSRQKADFLQWLAEVNQTAVFKFVVSSVPMMRLWEKADAAWDSDAWAGFLTERSELLDVMQYVPNVIVLSGDRHEFAAASLRQTITEFSTSPLSQFYVPFDTLSNATADGEDVALRYESKGSSKFSIFEVDTRTRNEPTVRADVIIDGAKAWTVTIFGQPIQVRGETGVGSLAQSLLELLGWTPSRRRRWF